MHNYSVIIVFMGDSGLLSRSPKSSNLRQIRLLISVLALLLCNHLVVAQESLSNLRTVQLEAGRTTFTLDTLSIAPGSVQLYSAGKPVAASGFQVDFVTAQLTLNEATAALPDLMVVYRVMPIYLSKQYQHKSEDQIGQTDKGVINPLIYRTPKKATELFAHSGLNKQGSISRGLSFGNNQDLAVNSNLNLQLSGKVSSRVSILAAITDDNIPIQAEGNTQQLQEFDQVYIQLFDQHNKLTAGDFQLRESESYFMKYRKKARGGTFNTRVLVDPKLKKGKYMQLQASAAVSRGKFSRNIIQGIEGNQGPYRLAGAEGETFIIVLSGTERVYIDGELLTRGQENDYVIDYNTAQLTFTARRLITKDKRIVVEFQYSDKNYARSLFQVSDKWETERLKLNVHFYSEQDGKNQPLQQTLNDDRRALLRNIGDSLNQALAVNADSVPFDEGLILYKLVDTLVADVLYDSVFVFSANPDSAFYRLGFSNVGFGNGNYELQSSLSNGKVYRWVAPVNGVPQGSFEPVILLITPKQRQMLIAQAEYQLSKNTVARVELAGTNNDINTFSNRDSGDDLGFAGKFELESKRPLKAKEGRKPWLLVSALDYEHVDRNFAPIERFRSVEFQRDWNLQAIDLSIIEISESQHISGASVGLVRGETGLLRTKVQSYNTATEFNALKNTLDARLKNPKWDIKGTASLVGTETLKDNTLFLRHNARIARTFKRWTLGVRELQDRNEARNRQTDSLTALSFNFYEVEGFVNNGDSAKNKYEVSYVYREDKAPRNDGFGLATVGQSVGFQMDLMKNANNKLRLKSSYRLLEIKDTAITNQKPDNTLLSRIEHSLRAFKGALRATTFYEIGSGLELRKEFQFLEVQPGQGVYSWNDYNDNGQQELDEFEIAQFSDQASYIKVFTPTNTYVKAFTNEFSQSVFITPRAVWARKPGLKGFLARFSNQTAFRIQRKTNYEDLASAYNPFVSEIADTSLISLNASFRNSVFFNKTHPKFGFELSYQDRRGKDLLTNGFESKSLIARAVNVRWNVTRQFLLNVLASDGEKDLLSDFFSRRNYSIVQFEVEPKLTYQPGTVFRIAGLFNYQEKRNAGEFGGELAINREIGLEGKYNSAEKGSFQGTVSYINISWNGENSSPVAYEMLNALQPGTNVTWSLSWQQTILKNLQLSFLYNGRGSETAKTVHTGGVQLRAFF